MYLQMGFSMIIVFMCQCAINLYLSIANAKVQNKIMTYVRQWAWLSAIQSTVEVRRNAYFFLFPALGGVLGRPAWPPSPNG